MQHDLCVGPDAFERVVVVRHLDAGTLEHLIDAMASGSLFTLRESFDVAKGSAL